MVPNGNSSCRRQSRVEVGVGREEWDGENGVGVSAGLDTAVEEDGEGEVRDYLMVFMTAAEEKDTSRPCSLLHLVDQKRRRAIPRSLANKQWWRWRPVVLGLVPCVVGSRRIWMWAEEAGQGASTGGRALRSADLSHREEAAVASRPVGQGPAVSIPSKMGDGVSA
jgi:hypothetical protein